MSRAEVHLSWKQDPKAKGRPRVGQAFSAADADHPDQAPVPHLLPERPERLWVRETLRVQCGSFLETVGGSEKSLWCHGAASARPF